MCADRQEMASGWLGELGTARDGGRLQVMLRLHCTRYSGVMRGGMGTIWGQLVRQGGHSVSGGSTATTHACRVGTGVGAGVGLGRRSPSNSQPPGLHDGASAHRAAHANAPTTAALHCGDSITISSSRASAAAAASTAACLGLGAAAAATFGMTAAATAGCSQALPIS